MVENDAQFSQLAYQNQQVWIGGCGYTISPSVNYTGNWNGYISIIRFYSKVLNEEEVKHNFDAQKERFEF